MAVVTVRNLPDVVHRALRVRAAECGRSAEAEILDILEAGGLTDAEVTQLNQLRDKTPAEAMGFE